jgi:hypothetical protein
MKRCPYATAFLVGLIIAQILATIQVHISNLRLYHSILAISDAGYLAVPNRNSMQTLPDLVPAFLGGLFFTVSVGAFITLLCLGAVWLWNRLRNRYVSILLVAIWAGCLVMVNIRGFELMVSLYFMLIPCAVVLFALRIIPAGSRKKKWTGGILHSIPVLILAVLWLTQMDAHLFLDVRDHLLLSNRLGSAINDFYYAYTLYPAEVFKTLDQKTVKTYRLEHIHDNALVRSIEGQLINYDYLRAQGVAPVDLIISETGSLLVLSDGKEDILEVSPQTFFSNTGKLLGEFSERCDRHRFFRQFTFYSFLVGFPIALYLVVFFLFRTLAGLFLSKGTSSIFASALCLMIGLVLFGFFVQSRVRGADVSDAAYALESERWQEKVVGLKLVRREGREISDFEAYRSMLRSPHTAVRYWLARSLAMSRNPETYDDLLGLLNDPQPNVVSMAFYALGRRGDTRAISIILEKIGSSDNWYSQWYAYRALRRLGWKQTGLP